MLRRAQRLGLDGAVANASQLVRTHEAALLEYGYVPHESGQGHGVRLGELRDRCIVYEQLLDDPQPRWVGQRTKHGIESHQWHAMA